MSNNTKYVRDAFKSLELVEDKEFDLFSEDSFEELDDYIKDEEDAETEQEVIDLEAENEEELKDSYVGDAILSCPVCHTNLFKPMDDVIVDDETKLCCAGEACPVCAQEDGFKVIGKVAPFEDAPEEEDEVDVDVETEPEGEETELEVKEKVHEAKKRIRGKKLQEKIAKRVGNGKLVAEKFNKNLKESQLDEKISTYGHVDVHELASIERWRDVLKRVKVWLVSKGDTGVYIYASDGTEYGNDYYSIWNRDGKYAKQRKSSIVATFSADNPNEYSKAKAKAFELVKNDPKLTKVYDPRSFEIKESMQLVKGKKLTEGLSVSEVEKFLEDSIKSIKEDPSVTARYVLDDDLCLYVGYEGGFDADETGSDERICAKIAEKNDYYWVDFEAMNQPWDPETGDVWDTDSEVSPSDAKYYVDEYKAIRKALNKGEVVLESKKSSNKGKKLKEEMKVANKFLVTFDSEDELVAARKRLEDAGWDIGLDSTDDEYNDDFYLEIYGNGSLSKDVATKLLSEIGALDFKVEECKKLTEAPIYDLDPRYDSRASFYGKAKVDTGDKNDQNKLYSYNTLVAEIKDGKPVVYGTYSQTTLRHIKDWLKQNGFKAENSKQILADYGVKDECVNESATLQEKRWKYKLKSGSELRAAIEEAQEEETEESYQAIFEALKVCIDELRDVITEKNGFDEDDFSWNFDDILEDLEYMDADEDNIDYILDKFYDSCDGLGIWINLTNESLGKKNLKEAYDKSTTFEEWFNDKFAKNPADWKKRFYPFDKYSKTFGVESLRNATADDIVKHAHEFYDVYDVDSSDREYAFSFASEVTGRDYDDFYNAWLSEKPLVVESFDEALAKVIRSRKMREGIKQVVAKAGLNKLTEAEEGPVTTSKITVDSKFGPELYKSLLTVCKDNPQMAVGAFSVIYQKLGKAITGGNFEQFYQSLLQKYNVKPAGDKNASKPAEKTGGQQQQADGNINFETKEVKTESINEDIEKATIETEDQVIEVSTEPKEENMNADWQAEGGELLDDASGDEMIAPLDDTDIDEIEANSEEEETAEEPVEEPAEETEVEETEETEEETTPEDEEEFNFDEIQEESFKRITESYLKKVYSNVKSFKINSAELKESLLTINGTIEFNSGKTRDTSFVFESKNDKTTIAKSKRRFVGLNETFTDKKNAYVLSTSLQGKKLVAESLRYDYPAKTSNLTEGVKTVKGFIK